MHLYKVLGDVKLKHLVYYKGYQKLYNLCSESVSFIKKFLLSFVGASHLLKLFKNFVTEWWQKISWQGVDQMDYYWHNLKNPRLMLILKDIRRDRLQGAINIHLFHHCTSQYMSEYYRVSMIKQCSVWMIIHKNVCLNNQTHHFPWKILFPHSLKFF